MGELQKKGFPLIGVMFLLLGFYKLVIGGNWVVWIIVGVLFGGLGAFGWKKGGDRA
jgi:hypothetical protein